MPRADWLCLPNLTGTYNWRDAAACGVIVIVGAEDAATTFSANYADMRYKILTFRFLTAGMVLVIKQTPCNNRGK